MIFDRKGAGRSLLTGFAAMVVLQVSAQALGFWLDRGPALILGFAAAWAIPMAVFTNIRQDKSAPGYGERLDGYRPEQDY